MMIEYDVLIYQISNRSCLSVFLSPNCFFPPSWAPQARSEAWKVYPWELYPPDHPPRPSQPKAGLGLVIIMMMIMWRMMTWVIMLWMMMMIKKWNLPIKTEKSKREKNLDNDYQQQPNPRASPCCIRAGSADIWGNLKNLIFLAKMSDVGENDTFRGV